MKNLPDFLLPCTQGGLNHFRCKMILIILLNFFTLFESASVQGQNLVPTINLFPNQITGGMDSRLNGIGRNHFFGFTNPVPSNDCKPWETRFADKMGMYRQINNQFSRGGAPVYRLGHNISDGNLSYDWNDSALPNIFPGWHWATDYKTGYDSNKGEYDLNGEENTAIQYEGYCNGWAACPQTTWQTNCPQTEERRLGAGVHRFFYAGTDQNGITLFRGRVITINYANGIVVNQASVPNNQNIQPNTTATWNAPTATLNGQTIISGRQISGPVSGQVLAQSGCYLVEYKFENGDQMAYCGFVVSVSPNSNQITLTVDPNEFYTINPATTQGTAKQRHSRQTIIKHGTIHNPSITPSSGTAWEVRAVGYDDISIFLQEAASLAASIAVVANIGTGYPEELRGLVEHLSEVGADLSYIELGSELMGFWNKGSLIDYYDITIPITPSNPFPSNAYLSPIELGQLTAPFARAIRQQDPTIPIAATSTYNMVVDFTNNGGITTIEGRVNAWLTALNQNGQLIDIFNVHNYPLNELARRNFDNAKAQDLLAVNQVFEEQVLPRIRTGIGQAGFPIDQIRFVLTESNTGESSIRNATQADKNQHNSITEGLFYAETFRMCAQNQFDALTPFAFIKAHNTGEIYTIQQGDPTNQASFDTDDPDFDILFYPNNGTVNPLYNPNGAIFRKPVFRIKKMMNEGLQPNLINFNATNIRTNPLALGGLNPVNIEELTFLPTVSDDGAFTHVLVTNLRNTANQLRLQVNGQNITTTDVVRIQGAAFNDKKPRNIR